MPFDAPSWLKHHISFNNECKSYFVHNCAMDRPTVILMGIAAFLSVFVPFLGIKLLHISVL